MVYEFLSNSIGEITTSGVVSNFTGIGISGPTGITAGPDGALWFTNSGNSSIGRITTAGMVSNFTGTGIDVPEGIAAGSDGALWFDNEGNSSIGRITTSGVVTNYSGSEVGLPIGIASGPDGAVWFTNSGNNSIGRIIVIPSIYVSPSSGPPGTAVTVNGGGYAANETVNVFYKTGVSDDRSVAVCSTTANPDGTFTCSGAIPTRATAGSPGSHKIAAKGSTSLLNVKTIFTLT